MLEVGGGSIGSDNPLTFPSYNQLNAFYGNPDANGDGSPDLQWEVHNIVKIAPPYRLFWSWSGEKVKTLRIHNKCAGSLLMILDEIGKEFSELERKTYQIDQCGGGYNFRLMRGGNRLSTHSWGCAIDLAPVINGLGVPYNPDKGMMPEKVVKIFKNHGWNWGGNWSRPDAMHFEAVT